MLTLDRLLSSSDDTAAAADSAMYLSSSAAPTTKPGQIDLYKDPSPGEMMIELSPNSAASLPHHESSGEDHEVKAPKKRAETWVQEEIRSLIVFRREMDRLFNTSKSNKHLWRLISEKMRDKGFDRSPTMCTDKWRNLLKEFKKAKHRCKGSGPAKMYYYKELDELLKERNKIVPNKSSAAVDSYLQFSEKGSNNHTSYGGRVIIVKWGEYTKKVGIDGTAEAIKESIKSAFGLRTRRAFWLEDEDEVVRCLDRNMPLGTYTLHLDEGVTIKVCICEDADHMTLRTEDKTLYTEEDFREFLTRRGWTCLREFSGFRTIDNLDDLLPGVMYQGLRL